MDYKIISLAVVRTTPVYSYAQSCNHTIDLQTTHMGKTILTFMRKSCHYVHALYNHFVKHHDHDFIYNADAFGLIVCLLAHAIILDWLIVCLLAHAIILDWLIVCLLAHAIILDWLIVCLLAHAVILDWLNIVPTCSCYHTRLANSVSTCSCYHTILA